MPMIYFNLMVPNVFPVAEKNSLRLMVLCFYQRFAQFHPIAKNIQNLGANKEY